MSNAEVLWQAPQAVEPLDATLSLPGSKSLTNRHLVLAALAGGTSTLRGALRARDTRLMVQALSALGARIDDDGEDLHVTGPLHGGSAGSGTVSGTAPDTVSGAGRPITIHCGLAGTVMRFVPALAALIPAAVHFTGDDGALVRPMDTLLGALRDLGVGLEGDGDGRLPITVHGTGSLPGGEVRLDSSASSQFVSALLLAGSQADAPLTVTHTGGELPSMPHVEMTCQVLEAAGGRVDRPGAGATSWTVHPSRLRPQAVTIEPDLSNAGPFLAAALVAGGCVTVRDWPELTTQAGDAWRDLLTAMGGAVSLGDEGLTVAGTGEIRGIDVDLHDVGELTCTVAALAALADSPSLITGIGHLRGHETDRVQALTAEIRGLGGQVEEGEDHLRITPAPLHGGVFRTYADHRMATAGAVIGLRVPGVQVQNIATTQKTMPDFVGMWLSTLHNDRPARGTW